MQDKLLNYFNGDDLASSVWLGKKVGLEIIKVLNLTDKLLKNPNNFISSYYNTEC